MKLLFTKLLVALMVLIPAKVDFNPFLDFVGKNFYPPESVKRICTWQYVIIKVKTDNNNMITSYHIENKVSTDLVNSFNFLKGYKFDKSKPVNKHSIVFCFSIENRRIDNCDVQKPSGYTHEEPIKKLNLYKLEQSKKGYSNLYIKKITTEMIYDPIE